MKIKCHNQHIYIFSMCVSLYAVINPKPLWKSCHIDHIYMFLSPERVLLSFVRVEFWAKHVPHRVHGKGFSPVWTHKRQLSLLIIEKDLSPCVYLGSLSISVLSKVKEKKHPKFQ